MLFSGSKHSDYIKKGEIGLISPLLLFYFRRMFKRALEFGDR
jgi:hypothetical protein